MNDWYIKHEKMTYTQAMIITAVIAVCMVAFWLVSK